MTSVDSILPTGNGSRVRPGTNGSRAAWQEPRKLELYDSDNKAAMDQPVMFGDMGDMPTAMESEVSPIYCHLEHSVVSSDLTDHS